MMTSPLFTECRVCKGEIHTSDDICCYCNAKQVSPTATVIKGLLTGILLAFTVYVFKSLML